MIKVQLIRNDEDCIVGEVKEFTITTTPEPENDNEYALFGVSFKDELEEVTLNKRQYRKLFGLDLFNIQAMKINVNEEDFVQTIRIYYLNKVETV